MNRPTMPDATTAVADRALELAFDELADRATPPDQLAIILQRTRALSAAPPVAAHRTRWLVAAAAFVGIAATCALGWLARQHPAADAVAVAQEPRRQEPVAPPAKPAEQEPKQQGPKPQEPKPQEPKQQEPGKQEPGKQGPKPSPAKQHSGSTAADLLAQRGAEAMLAAEKKLAQMLKEGKIAGIDSILPFETLSGWRYEKGLAGCPEAVKALDGKKVLMTGFMLPIDEVTNIQHFLLVKSLWSCCYGTPPDINGIVRCVMPKGKTSDYHFEPLKIIGTLRVRENIEDGYCVDIYQLDVDVLEVIE